MTASNSNMLRNLKFHVFDRTDAFNKGAFIPPTKTYVREFNGPYRTLSVDFYFIILFFRPSNIMSCMFVSVPVCCM